MEASKENIIKAYNVAKQTGADSTCKVFEALYPDIDFTPKDNRPVTERIKTFEDAVEALGEDHTFVQMFHDIFNKSEVAGANANDDVVAYLKLRIITAALNEGWEPQFTEEEWRYYPWFYLWTEEELADKDEEWKQDRNLQSLGGYNTGYAGLAYANSYYAPSYTPAHFGSRLCFKNATLAEYAGKQFLELWMPFYLIHNGASLTSK